MSSPAFTSLVDLCRLAKSRRVSGADLALVLVGSAEASSLLSAVEAGGWANTLYLDSNETTKRLEDFFGQEVKIIIHGITRSNQVVANNVGMMLRLARGKYLGEAPTEFYLVDENYASWEPASHPDVLAYERAIRLVNLVRKLADVVRERDEAAGEAVVLANRKLVIPFFYEPASLARTASKYAIDSFEEAVFKDHHAEARREIAKRVLVRFLDVTPEMDRFGDFLQRLQEIEQAFKADFDVYASGFSFDKARDEFERKKLDFVVKTNTASSDAMNKLIAIPVGQGLLASQMKTDADLSFVNLALLIGSLVFAFIAAALIINHINVLRQIRAELRTEKDLLWERAMPTYRRLADMITALDNRITFHMTWVPGALAALLVVTTSITIVAYWKLTNFS